jgi:hypothetical protein
VDRGNQHWFTKQKKSWPSRGLSAKKHMPENAKRLRRLEEIPGHHRSPFHPCPQDMEEQMGAAEEAQEAPTDEEDQEDMEAQEAQEVQEVQEVQAVRTDPEIMMMKEATTSAVHLSIAAPAVTAYPLKGE